MKIGILTFHRAINYGAVLQCYALQQVLKSFGHQVEVIDYRPPYLEQYRKFFSFYTFRRTKGVWGKIKLLIGSLLTIPQKYKARRSFDFFLKRYLCLSNVVMTSKDISENYDYIICGSDQIWSPSIGDGFDKIYWGDFPHNSFKFVAYAASVGGHNKLSEGNWDKIRSLIQNFNKVSVRENELKTGIERKVGITPTLVTDPTFLAEPQLFDLIVEKPSFDDYVLVFTLEKESKAIPFAKKIAEQINASRIVKLNAIRPITDNEKDVTYVNNVTPNLFLGYFKYAKCIITISFHGTAFSVIFRKDFYCLKSNQMDRARNLLESVQLSDRIVNVEDDISFSPISYSEKNVDTLTEKLRSSSLLYLKSSII